MQGLGFLIWQLASVPGADELIRLAKKYNIRWYSIKLANGILPYNQTGNNDKELKALIQALQDAGIEVGGWHYSYCTQVGLEGDRAMERIEKLNLSHWLVDIEGEWSQPYGMPAAAKLYMSKLKVGGLQVGLCSYRYPNYWLNVPFPAFLNHEAMDVNAPQVYWEGAHNPAAQLDRSLSEYSKITGKPFIPIGATYGHTQKDKSWWEPTIADLQQFVAWCKDKRVPAYGFYSLDWLLTRKHYDWLEAITGVAYEPPPPPPPPVEPPPAELPEYMTVTAGKLNIRHSPAVLPDNIFAVLPYGTRVKVEKQDGDWVKLSAWVSKNYLK